MRHPQGIIFYLEGGREREATIQDDRMTIWGDSYYWYSVNENLARYKYFVIHHSVTPANWTPNQIALLHKARDWDGVGYHWIITSDGVIHYVGDLGTIRAHVLNRNHECIGVLLVGDFRDGRRPTDAQYIAANVLWREFLADGRFSGIKNINALKFHRELQPTACPCDVNKDFIANGLRVAYAPAPIETPYQPKPVSIPTPEIKLIEVKPLPAPSDPTIGAGTPTEVVKPKEIEKVYEKPSEETLKEQQKGDKMEIVKNLIAKGDVLQGEKRNIAIVVMLLIGILKYFGVEVLEDQALNLVNSVAFVVAVIGVVYAKIRK